MCAGGNHLRSMHAKRVFSFSDILTIFLHCRSFSHLTTVVPSLPSWSSLPMRSLHRSIVVRLAGWEKWERQRNLKRQRERRVGYYRRGPWAGLCARTWVQRSPSTDDRPGVDARESSDGPGSAR